MTVIIMLAKLPSCLRLTLLAGIGVVACSVSKPVSDVDDRTEQRQLFQSPRYGLSIELPPGWTFEREYVSVLKPVEVCKEIWRFDGMDQGHMTLRIWEMDDSTDSCEFIDSFVMSLFTPVWTSKGQLKGRHARVLYSEGENGSHYRTGVVIDDEKYVMLIDFNAGLDPSRFDNLDEIIDGLSMEPGSFDEDDLPRLPPESRYPRFTRGGYPTGGYGANSCCGYVDTDNPYPCCSAGNCTWWSHYRRTCDLPDEPTSWGDAHSWANAAIAAGYNTGSGPSLNSIAVFQKNQAGCSGGYGHTAYVTNLGTSSYDVDEMGCETWNCLHFNSYTNTECSPTFIYNSKMGPIWDFCEGDNGTLCFTTANIGSEGCNGGSWTMDPSGNDPHISSQGAMHLDLNSYPYFEVRMSTTCESSKAQVFYSVDDGKGQFTETNSKKFDIINDGLFHTYSVDMSSAPNWNGHWLRRIRLDPVVSCNNSSGNAITINWMRLQGTSDVDISFVGAEWTGSYVLISWSTSYEKDLFGFQVLRSNSPETGYLPVNDQWIKPGKFDYVFQDFSTEIGNDYFYAVESIDLSGATVRTEPTGVSCE